MSVSTSSDHSDDDDGTIPPPRVPSRGRRRRTDASIDGSVAPSGVDQQPRTRQRWLMLKLMTWLSLNLGRTLTRPIVYGISLYFLAFAPKARRASRALSATRARTRAAVDRPLSPHRRVRHVDPRPPVPAERALRSLRHRDRGRGRSSPPRATSSRGAFLMGAHMGSFELIHALGRRQKDVRGAMVMYEENARRINALMAAINPAAQQDIIPLGRIDSMLLVRRALNDGVFVGVLGDRSFADDATVPIPFLGQTAWLPSSPFRMAAVLKRSVIFMVGLWLGGNRYKVLLRAARGLLQQSRDERDAAVRAAMHRYAALLEQHCVAAPYNWFNFFDFWQVPASARGRAGMSYANALRAKASAWTAVHWRCRRGAATPAPAALSPSSDLMRMLAQRGPESARFVEKKYLAVLDNKPVESSGELRYVPPNRIEKRTLKPKPDSLVVDGDKAIVERERPADTLQAVGLPGHRAVRRQHSRDARRRPAGARARVSTRAQRRRRSLDAGDAAVGPEARDDRAADRRRRQSRPGPLDRDPAGRRRSVGDDDRSRWQPNRCTDTAMTQARRWRDRHLDRRASSRARSSSRAPISPPTCRLSCRARRPRSSACSSTSCATARCRGCC